MKRIAIALATVLGGGLLWYGAVNVPSSAPEMIATGKPEIGTWGFDLSGMDKTVKPGDDFFRHVNGAWFDKAVIPADRANTGSFLDLRIRSENQVQAIIAELDQKTELSEIERKVRDLYHSYVDAGRLEQLGLEPAQADLQAIAALATYEDVVRAMASIRMRTQSLFNSGIGIDDKAPSKYAVFVSHSGLGLPDRDYYTGTQPNIVTARNAYKTYISTMLDLGGVADTVAKAEAIFALEAKIAALHWPRPDRRDADKMFNPVTLPELARFAPDFPWAAYFAEMGIHAPAGGERTVVIGERSSFPPLASLFAATSVPVWRDYLTFHYLDSHAVYLPKRFDDARFDFRGKILNGQAQLLDRAKRGVQFLDQMIGEAVGQIYVAKHFPPLAKEKAEALVANLMKVYHARVQELPWMGEATRAKAAEKAGNFDVKIGYPDNWRDYTKFEVIAGDLMGNQARGAEFAWQRDVVRLDDPVDRSEWGMSPQTVNAYYNASLNQIVFPAAILQPPFFDAFADDAVNYGGIGAVIGHEISHGFDDQGSKYDANGVLQNWWTATDRSNFDGRTARLVGQYDTYSPIEGVFVNGKLTLGENIADLSGLTVTHAAYRLSLAGKEPPVLDGYDGDQRLFLGYAQVWRAKYREALLQQMVVSDPHSPPHFRVNGAVRNVEAWYQAFGAGPGESLYLAPEERVILW